MTSLPLFFLMSHRIRAALNWLVVRKTPVSKSVLNNLLKVKAPNWWESWLFHPMFLLGMNCLYFGSVVVFTSLSEGDRRDVRMKTGWNDELWRWRKGPWAKAGRQPLTAGKGTKTDPPWTCPAGPQLCRLLYPVRLILDFWPPEL